GYVIFFRYLDDDFLEIVHIIEGHRDVIAIFANRLPSHNALAHSSFDEFFPMLSDRYVHVLTYGFRCYTPVVDNIICATSVIGQRSRGCKRGRGRGSARGTPPPVGPSLNRPRRHAISGADIRAGMLP